MQVDRFLFGDAVFEQVVARAGEPALVVKVDRVEPRSLRALRLAEYRAVQSRATEILAAARRKVAAARVGAERRVTGVGTHQVVAVVVVGR